MNFKLEDFDMVKTIGTGKNLDLCHFILGRGVLSQNMCFIVSHTFMDARFFLKSVTPTPPRWAPVSIMCSIKKLFDKKSDVRS